jgi:fatty-acyl-CoA synthase
MSSRPSIWGLMLDLLEQERPSFMPSVPTMTLAMREHESFSQRDLSALRVIMAGSTTISPEIVRMVEEDFGWSFISCFGQTEASGVIALGHPDDALADKSGRVGQPLEQVDVKVIDPASGQVVPCGVVGEFCLRGYTTMQEYFGMPDATGATIDDEGWLHTGDRGIMDSRGYLQVSGRLKEVIIRAGEHLPPGDRGRPRAAPGNQRNRRRRAAGRQLGEQGAAVVRTAPGVVPEPAAWRSFARGRLASAKVPKRWFLIDAMPTNPSGKIQKHRLRGIVADGGVQKVTPPRD